MHIQTLTTTDASRYRALMLHAYEAAADAFTSTAAERAAEPESWWLRRIAGPDSLSTVCGAFEGDELVGAVTVEFASKTKLRHKAHIIGMFVLAQARGAGVGKQLLDAALAAARAQPGVKVVTLTVTEGNVPAIRLYESCGFQPFGVEPMAIHTPSGFKSKVHMWLPLQSADGAD
ncbi:GNAT family acetyltransferase [Hylemonella gracilis str. Niagara R]|uniref:GNAT family acetyltransferase n=1 Tax=Hylemonella gracilis str. Niagara R TaxID=1458275 RepID=A0A016XI90_9BURK|nr:GNAT family N-acetyltransferase [Hylemonella gracilis]EYC51829.1 GNAT family acetyltransferase [Hylemonella gracilis str. Niagara R]